MIASIRWVACNNGSWANYRNKQQTILVVDELKNILIKNKKEGLLRSVGIITFNSTQQDEISEEIERRKQRDPEFSELSSIADNEQTNLLEDLPFVRNIETVSTELQKLGYNVDLHIGHSDYKINLAVVHPDLPSRYILAIEFDRKSFLNAQC